MNLYAYVFGERLLACLIGCSGICEIPYWLERGSKHFL